MKTAAEPGFTDVRAGIMPEGKLTVVRGLQAKGEIVMVVSDGINGAPALKQAVVGVAMDSADITLVKARPEDAVGLPGLGRGFQENPAEPVPGFFYIVMVIRLAMAGVMHPLAAGVARIPSSLNVIFNSLSIKRDKIV